MGKSKKNKLKNSRRHNPLEQEILENRYAQPSSRQKTRRKQPKDDEFVDNKLTNEILKQAQRQREDSEEEHGFSVSKIAPLSSLDSNDPFQNDDAESEFTELSGTEDAGLFVTSKISEEDEKALENFMCTMDSQKRATLADIIKETLTEKKTEICTVYSADVGNVCSEILNGTEDTFKALAPALKAYSSGKLPKAFKCIPNFSDWEHKLCLTEPDKWSRAAMYQATRIFASNLEDSMVQRFYNKILLPRLRDEIAECKTLNFHLYQALKKALFKPAAFFKGMIIPLCKSKNCTLREATIFGSVIAKCSIPVLHSSAALLTIAQMDYYGANSIFMRNLIEKKYALPYRALNAVVAHFLGFMKDNRKFPLLWHQCLLTFVQMYKADLSIEQKTGLLKLLTVHHHEHISSEIHKELQGTMESPVVLQQFWKL